MTEPSASLPAFKIVLENLALFLRPTHNSAMSAYFRLILLFKSKMGFGLVRYLARALPTSVCTCAEARFWIAGVHWRACCGALARNALWEVSVTQLTLVTLLAPELLTAHAAARVHITLLCHGPQRVTAACLQRNRGKNTHSIHIIYNIYIK